MGRRTIAVAGMFAGALMIVAGCDANTDDASPRGSTTSKAVSTANLWDPCTQISVETIRSAGLDPTTRDTTISGVPVVPGWKLCSWHDKPSNWSYSLGVWSTVYNVGDLKGDQNNIDFTDVSVAGRPGVRFHKANDHDNRVCYLAFPSGTQTIEVSIYKAFTTKSPADDRDPCSIAADAAAIIAPTFPS